MRRLLIIAFPVLALAGGAAWWLFGRPPEVTTVSPSRGPAVEAIYATGTVEPQRWAALAATDLGRIVAFPATEGALVGEGDILVQLDDEALRAEVEELSARVTWLESEVARYAKLVAQDNASRQSYDRLLSELAQAKAAVRARQQRLSDMTIIAPFDAVVLRTERELGEVVKAGDPLVWVGQPPPFWVTADVDEEDIPRVHPGQKVLIASDAFVGKVYEGKVGDITPQGDPINKQYRVRVLLPAEQPLLVGMTTEVNIVVREETAALLLPETALLAGGVFVLDGETVHYRAVTLGVFGAKMVEILAGVAEGELVVDNPPVGLVDGDSVRVSTP